MIIIRQKEFGRTGKSAGQAKMWFEGGNGKKNKFLKRAYELEEGMKKAGFSDRNKLEYIPDHISNYRRNYNKKAPYPLNNIDSRVSLKGLWEKDIKEDSAGLGKLLGGVYSKKDQKELARAINNRIMAEERFKNPKSSKKLKKAAENVFNRSIAAEKNIAHK